MVTATGPQPWYTSIRLCKDEKKLAGQNPTPVKKENQSLQFICVVFSVINRFYDLTLPWKSKDYYNNSPQFWMIQITYFQSSFWWRPICVHGLWTSSGYVAHFFVDQSAL